jgi:ferredoxin-thioredoxin reductase catalytic chain
MNSALNIEQEIEAVYQRLRADALASGYFLNPDVGFCKDLIRGLLENKRRYGYMSCPCRLASGEKAKDLDIICPCDYRDADVTEFGACYCALYVSRAAYEGKRAITSIPERRMTALTKTTEHGASGRSANAFPYPVWRCTVCGYLCAREEPPDMCPICKVSKERFERFA